jgi:hypothetical protein
MFDDILKSLKLDDRLHPASKVAPMLGLSPQTLAVWRHRKNNGQPAPDLPYVKLGRRAIRYRMRDVNNFIDQNLQVAKRAADSEG